MTTEGITGSTTLIGVRTAHHTDVTLPIYAGKAGERLKKVGKETFRHYFDNSQKDFQVGSERIKRIIK